MPLKQSIALNMIVKNESHVIAELLRSMSPYINYWTIVDTGSTDDTPKIISETMSELGIKGALHHSAWKDFGTNRSEALALAKGTAEYHWVIDADDQLVGELVLPHLTHASYYLRYGKGFTYLRQQIFRDDLPWRYVGVLHEYPFSGSKVDIGTIEGNYYIDSRRLGARNKNPRKYLDDAQVLEDALIKEPDNTRYWFYLGQSYFDAGEFQKALEAYQKRSSQDGWVEEKFYSMYKSGLCAIKLNKSQNEIINLFLNAFKFRPSRIEPLYQLAKFLREVKEFELSAMFARQAMTVSMTKDLLFVDAYAYTYGAKDEFSVSAYYSQIPSIQKEGFAVCRELSQMKDAPEEVIKRATQNLDWYNRRL